MNPKIMKADEVYNILFPNWINTFDDAGCLDLLDYILPELDVLYENSTIYPVKNKVFRAFNMSPNKVRVIILGQDPYHSSHNGKPDACGYSFLTENGYFPPSLKVMYKELQRESSKFQKMSTMRASKDPVKVDVLKRGVPIGLPCNTSIENYNFKKWINQGILMLNTALTVEAGKPGSHLRFWNQWSTNLISYLTEMYPDIVWVLLGNKAQDCLKNYSCKKIEVVHPSPLAGNKFLGCGVYSKINDLLDNPIVW